MTRWLCLCLATTAPVGCSNSSADKKDESKPEATSSAPKTLSASEHPPNKEPPETKPAAKEANRTVKTAQEAREELQARIDRYLGQGQRAL